MSSAWITEPEGPDDRGHDPQEPINICVHPGSLLDKAVRSGEALPFIVAIRDIPQPNNSYAYSIV